MVGASGRTWSLLHDVGKTGKTEHRLTTRSPGKGHFAQVRTQHSRQLRVVKNQTTSLTEEWDTHIRETEAAASQNLGRLLKPGLSCVIGLCYLFIY